MKRSIYYINPIADGPTYFSAENFAARGLRKTTQIADLAIPTLAALTPSDFDISLCDENIGEIDFDTPAELVGITGKITQGRRMIAIAQEFRRRGKTVLIGGPYASLSPNVLRPHCDILVRGEIETLADKLFSDLRAGSWQTEYEGDRPALSESPIPRWDLYPNNRAIMGTLQTSRGCPFECEFCDVIQYLGRKQRHKSPEQVVQELDVLYAYGYRSVFLADDNFTVFRERARQLLRVLRDWNLRQEDGHVVFLTQLSIEVSKDDEILQLCAEAGLITVFIGIETPNEASLKEAKKRQNLHLNLESQIERFFAHGIMVIGGMIVGFDADGTDIFERQYDFAMRSGIPIFSLGALVAPAATPLYARKEREGKLKPQGSEVAAVPWATNLVHARISQHDMASGMRWLANKLYSPEVFTRRARTFIDKFGERLDPQWLARGSTPTPRAVDMDCLDVVQRLPGLGAAEAKMWTDIMSSARAKPQTVQLLFGALLQYMQIRHMYASGQFWDTHLARESAPKLGPRLTPLRLHASAR